MKRLICWLVTSVIFLPNFSYAQSEVLVPGKIVEKNLLKGENHLYTISLQKGEYAECTVMQKSVDVAIDVISPSGKKLTTFDSPNGKKGAEPVSIIAVVKGTYKLRIYPLADQASLPDSLKASWAEENQGDYAVTDIKILSATAYKQKLAQQKQDKDQFAQWIRSNSKEIKTVDAGNGFEDLIPFKAVFENARVVGLGEASHGTSEFFRMKHRLLEFLIKEIGFTSFYIEASMTRCRYINDYVLYGKGNLDTATAIQGFTTWRVEEVRNMIEWLRRYNASVPAEKRVKFMGYDLQINDNGWKELKNFYGKVQAEKLVHLDSLMAQLDSVSLWSNSMSSTKEGADLFKTLYQKCLQVMNDIVLNEGQYRYIVGTKMYEENLMNIKLIVQEVESFKNGYNDRRDYYMAQNILDLLNHEKPGAKVAVWAHNGHIAKYEGTMGYYLDKVLKQDYYAVGFEFYSGSFQSRNMDTSNGSRNWDVITIGAPPKESLPWYFNTTGKDKLFIDFRNTGTNNIHNFSRLYNVHSFGSIYSKKMKETYPETLQIFDGMIYIKTSTAAKNFTQVIF